MNPDEKQIRFRDVSEEWLRAWADAGVITVQEFVEELAVRKAIAEKRHLRLVSKD